MFVELETDKNHFKGKEYDAYEARQKQRQMETAMRAQRAKVRGLERGGADPEDITIAKARYQGQMAEYKAFSEAMGIKPQMNRVYIDGLGRVAPGRGVAGLSIRSPGSSASYRKSLESIRAGKAGLSKARQEMLRRVPEAGSYHDFKHGKITAHDLAYLSAAVGVEFALFRSKNADRLVRGERLRCDLSPELAQEILSGGFYWVAHTHVDLGALFPSQADRETLRRLGQQESVIIGADGAEKRFTKDEF